MGRRTPPPRLWLPSRLGAVSCAWRWLFLVQHAAGAQGLDGGQFTCLFSLADEMVLLPGGSCSK